MRKNLLYIIAIILVASNSTASDISFFPPDKIITNPHSSLLRSPAIDVLYIYSTNEKKNLTEYNFGSKFPMLSINGKNSLHYETGGYGGIFTSFEFKSESYDFVHADFLGGAFFDIKYNNLSFETNLYHESSHIGDDYIYYENPEIINIGYEALKQYINYIPSTLLELSIGFEYKLSRRPKEKIFYNKSVLIGNRIDIYSKGIPVFMECELEIIGLHYAPNFGIKVGVYLSYLFNNILLGKQTTEKELHEFSLYYYCGYSKMGYFYDERERLILIGPTYRF